MKNRRTPIKVVARALFGAVSGLTLLTLGRSLSAEGHSQSAFRPCSECVAVPTHDSRFDRITVDTIGGSAAKGWKDCGWRQWRHGWHGGYLARAFRRLSQTTGVNFEVVDHTVVGSTPRQLATMYRGQLARWLNHDRPNIVVISWGLMNDLHAQTPVPEFAREVKSEIKLCLAHHASVLVVTPPITEASYRQYRLEEPMYVDAELMVVRSMHNPNVLAYDVFNEMRCVVNESKCGYMRFVGDSIHPNALGHSLAGNILYRDLFKGSLLNPVWNRSMVPEQPSARM